MILPMVKMDVILDANDHLKNTFSDQQVSFSLINSKTTFSPAGGRDEADGGQAQGEKIFPSSSIVKTSPKRTLKLWNAK